MYFIKPKLGDFSVAAQKKGKVNYTEMNSGNNHRKSSESNNKQTNKRACNSCNIINSH